MMSAFRIGWGKEELHSVVHSIKKPLVNTVASWFGRSGQSTTDLVKKKNTFCAVFWIGLSWSASIRPYIYG